MSAHLEERLPTFTTETCQTSCANCALILNLENPAAKMFSASHQSDQSESVNWGPWNRRTADGCTWWFVTVRDYPASRGATPSRMTKRRKGPMAPIAAKPAARVKSTGANRVSNA
jgi:hypothetical protein